ncbi:hypothetical protein [Pseudogulbenkiania sp. MAI-1]|uniref:hypothetical protein n=1 Tax=Pseudogulbenkiania sp. MAI-1 TaxID=990370 RepID=UPI00045E655A|nr:hypothetical protein [Pseudogulbenkiania sp. MAI-1]
MDAATKLKLYAHIQHVARHFSAWKGGIESLVAYINYDLGADAIEPAQLENFLRRAENQRELEAHYETALWQGPNKQFRLVCLAITDDPQIAKRRLEHFPADKRRQCAFCYIDEGQFVDLGLELFPELDLRREIVPGRYLHNCCRRPWAQLRLLAERADAEPDKESLL